MMDKMPLKKGTIVVISSGEYSDYYVNGVVKIAKDCNFNDAIKEVGKTNTYSLMVKLLKAGYIEDVEYTEVHLGSYGEIYPQICHEGGNKWG